MIKDLLKTEQEKDAAKIAIDAHKEKAHYAKFSEIIYQGILAHDSKLLSALREEVEGMKITGIGDDARLVNGKKCGWFLKENEKIVYNQALSDILKLVTAE